MKADFLTILFFTTTIFAFTQWGFAENDNEILLQENKILHSQVQELRDANSND